MYGAMIMACWWRYKVRASLDHQPRDFMTSKGTPCSKNSSIPPIRIPCPLRSISPRAVATVLILSKKVLLVNGQKPLRCLYANRCPLAGGLLTWRWFSSRALGSVMLSWYDQNTSYPSVAHFVFGRWNTVTSKPLWSLLTEISDGLTCHVGSNAVRVGTVNSPVRATE